MRKEDFTNEFDELDIEDEYGFEFDDEEINERRGSKVKHGRKGNGIHFVFLAVVLVIIAVVVVRVAVWNRGTTDDTEVVVDEDFDVEPNDYIQPLSAQDMQSKTDDGVDTILTLGNSPFADGGEDNNLAKAIAKSMDATVINGGIPESFLTQRYNEFSADYEYDGISLYSVTNALCSGDFSVVDEAAHMVSEDAVRAVEKLKSVDMSSVDCIMIMYDLSDYVDHRPLASDTNLSSVDNVYGTLSASLAMVRENYPWIRIVLISTPCCGKTIDNYYVDGDANDLGYGTLTEYMTMESMAASSIGVSFVDIYYGAINIENREAYLYDDYHINDDGAEVIARRLAKLIKL